MIPELTEAEITRFHAKIGRSAGCWLWQTETNNKGYGRFPIYREGKRIRLLAHRVAYLLAHGCEPAAGLVLRHSCDTPPCCNPEHLTTGTQADNIRDAVERGRNNTAGLAEYRHERDAAVPQRLKTGEKRCSRCQATKTLADFHKNRCTPDGVAYHCKACATQIQREYRERKHTSERERRRLRANHEQEAAA